MILYITLHLELLKAQHVTIRRPKKYFKEWRFLDLKMIIGPFGALQQLMN